MGPTHVRCGIEVLLAAFSLFYLSICAPRSATSPDTTNTVARAFLQNERQARYPIVSPCILESFGSGASSLNDGVIKQVLRLSDDADMVVLTSPLNAAEEPTDVRTKGIVFEVPKGALLIVTGSALRFEANEVDI